MRMGQGVRTGLGHDGILQTQFSSFVIRQSFSLQNNPKRGDQPRLIAE